MSRYVVGLEAEAATRVRVTGGKGATLARLVRAGLPVPRGFCVTTAVYDAVVDTAEVRAAIASLEGLDPGETEAIAERSATVRSAIRARRLPGAVRSAVADALDAVDAGAYAVRSSATAEDLPTASFAGQHETFLGVAPGAVLDRVRDCLASLFTERAVTYRLRNGVSHADTAMAVVVQALVEADVAGVCFTADPVSGNRRVASVDASFGLGDAVVAGDVSPDNARVDRTTGEVLDYEIGEKRRAVRSAGSGRGGTEFVDLSRERRASRALSDARLRALVDLGGRVADLLGGPQDVEWALVDGEFVLLQARPITSLFPLPEPRPADGRLHVYLSFGHAQAMPEALPPLVADFWRRFLERGAARFRADDARGPWAVEAGGRVYLDLTPLLRIGPLRRVLPGRVAAVNEPAAAGLRALLDRRGDEFASRGPSGDASPGRGRLTHALGVARTLGNAAPVLLPVLAGIAGRVATDLLAGPPDPERERGWVERWGRATAARLREPGSPAERVRAAFGRIDFSLVVTELLPRIGSHLLAAVVARRLLARLVPGADADLDAVGKGFEAELVTQMNQRLGDLADVARERPAVRAALREGRPVVELEAVEGGAAFAAAFEAYLDAFGHRASGEIDLRRPRWRDDPETLVRTIRSNLVRNESGTHREHLRSLERDAETATERLEARAGRGLLGPAKRVLVRRLVRTYRGGISLREYPKQGIAHVFAAVHDEFSAAGEALAADGRLDDPDDVWFLRAAELLAALGDDGPVDAPVAARRRTHARHAATNAPPLLTSEGETPAATGSADRSGNALAGTPVSSGVAEGPARVIRDPSGESLERGEILVAPSTDPGWTPLFLNAAGLVMEVGGRMTHGALVAREYGIPAVAAVSGATTEIESGERLRVDGTHGTVELLDRE